jgi:hypothetical protein
VAPPSGGATDAAGSSSGGGERINPRFNPCCDDAQGAPADDRGMTTTDYIVNAAFVLVVFRQARERALDRRSLVGPFALMFFVAQQYLRSIPTAGNDLVLVGALAAVGVTLGTVCGIATHIRVADDGVALTRVGCLAGGLLIAGICARIGFAFAVGHGAGNAVRGFSIAHGIGAAAWPVALVSMALLEVTARLLTVQVRGRRIRASHRPLAVAA